MSGYSQTPLEKKLGFKPGMKVAIQGAPRGFLAGLDLPAKVKIDTHGQDHDMVIYFVNSFAQLKAKMRTLRRMIKQEGMIWICWPKLGGKLLRDFNEDDIRRLAISFQLVDVKVISVNEAWSGLKLVVPTALRTKGIA